MSDGPKYRDVCPWCHPGFHKHILPPVLHAAAHVDAVIKHVLRIIHRLSLGSYKPSYVDEDTHIAHVGQPRHCVVEPVPHPALKKWQGRGLVQPQRATGRYGLKRLVELDVGCVNELLERGHLRRDCSEHLVEDESPWVVRVEVFEFGMERGNKCQKSERGVL